MRPIHIVVALLCIVATGAAAQRKPESDLERISYSLGADIGRNFKLQGIQIDAGMIAEGIRDAMAGGTMKMSDADMEKTVTAFQEVMMKVQKDKAAKDSYENRKQGELFLEENRKKEGVVSLPSGLQYKVIKQGNGPKPTATDRVTVHYRGTLLNGKEFDSSYRTNQPVTFPLNQMIRGWIEGLQLMASGSTYQFFIPSDLAYGDRQMGPDISPGSTLIFEVELIKVEK